MPSHAHPAFFACLRFVCVCLCVCVCVCVCVFECICESLSRCAMTFATSVHPLHTKVGGIPLILFLGFGFLLRAKGVKCGTFRV